MPYTMFSSLFPKIAAKQTRTLTVDPKNRYQLPPDSYGLLELYCDDEDCDCRRVFFMVMSEKAQDVVATISYGWESKDFYAKWFDPNRKATYDKLDKGDQYAVDEMYGFQLNPMSPQSKIAPQLLALVEDCVLADEDYIKRLRRHYKLFRAKVDAKHEKEGADL